MDWASRKVLAWRLSNTLDVSFCTEALEEAIMKYGIPEIFNSYQGSQFTSEALPAFSMPMGSRPAWMVRVVGWIMCLSNGFGEA